MITLVEDQYVVTVGGWVVGRFDRYDEALDAYLEIVPTSLAF